MKAGEVAWKEQGSCVDADVDLFFPTHPRLVPAKAKALCRDCPVLSTCFTYALRYELFGVWAGISEDEREKIRRRRGITLTSPQLRQIRIDH